MRRHDSAGTGARGARPATAERSLHTGTDNKWTAHFAPGPVLPPVSRAAGRARTWATVERSLHESQQLRGAAARRSEANAGSVVLTAEAEDRLVNKVLITTLLITTLAITHHYSPEGGIL